MKHKWELSKSDKQIINYCKEKGYPIKLKKELISGNVYIITMYDKEISFKNDVTYISGGALKALKMTEEIYKELSEVLK
jgi:hypothetical protein